MNEEVLIVKNEYNIIIYTMATAEHKELSGFIKTVHSSLRKRAKKIGYDLAWKEHCGDENNLKKYAKSMKTLATKHWSDNQKNNAKVISRISWVHSYCQQYFYGEELKRQRSREIEILDKIETTNSKPIELKDDLKDLELLDVGSCYNPFKELTCFQVLAIDIAPACDDVYKCDFINTEIAENFNTTDKTINRLKADAFHVVVFSLLLEYLPSPEQRLLCCKKAYALLKTEGILVIITPDSKHVGANAKFMKSWRYILSKIGFSRIKYEKLPYLHCMVFRKSICSDVAVRWATLNEDKDFYDKLYIPQDLQENVDEIVINNIKESDKSNYIPEIPVTTM